MIATQCEVGACLIGSQDVPLMVMVSGVIVDIV